MIKPGKHQQNIKDNLKIKNRQQCIGGFENSFLNRYVR